MNGVGTDVKADWRRKMELRLRQEEQSDDFVARLRAAEQAVVGWCADSLPSGSVVTVFGGLKREVDLVTGGMAPLRAMGLRTAAFALNESVAGEMEAIEVLDEADFRRGMMGVWEPVRMAQRVVAPETVQAVLVPGLAFCPHSGFRLGRGGGYFDRYLSRVRPETVFVGVGLECQVVDGVPHEAHDVPVQWIITEQRVLKLKG